MTGETATDATARDLRARVLGLVDSRAFKTFITVVIIINAIDLGFETSGAAMLAAGGFLVFVDEVCIVIFVIELLLRLYARGWRFFRNGWNLFDVFVVAIALIPHAGAYSALRALRILRVFRLLSQISSMRLVSESAIAALPGLSATFLVLALIYYVFAVICTTLFGAAFPQWFGNIGESLYSLFQIMTLESWSMGIVRPVMETYPHAWMVFVPFVMITAFFVLNLVVAILVESVDRTKQEQARAQADFEPQPTMADLSADIARLAEEVERLRADVAGRERRD